MSLTNISKPTTSLTNDTKINIGETWATWLVQWQNETRTWAQFASIITNNTKISSSITNVSRPA